jgi:RluA family pseudouridine synthase
VTTHSVIKLSSPATHEYWEISILFQDEYLLALDKPAGLLVSPDRYDPERPNLMKLLHDGIAEGKPWAREHNITYLSNAHRLDFETSGVLLLAKTKPVLVALANAFGSGAVKKKYTALAQGEPREGPFTVDAKLSPHPIKVNMMRVDPRRGKKSKTNFEVVEAFSKYVLIKCEPVTGRTHQIRVHLRHARLPIVGDTLYHGRPLMLSRLKKNYRLKGGKTERPLMSRVALHAEELTVTHPVTNQPVTITAPWPKDLTVAVKYLRQYGK